MPLPGNRPSTKPGIKPGERPSTLPSTRPGIGDRPGTGIGDRPNNRPGSKPWVRPGSDRPTTRPIKHPDFGNNRPGGGRPGSGNNNWINIGNRPAIGNNINVNINNNFKRNLNWSTNRRHWGYNPWWNRPSQRPWYGGCWGYGWNNRWHHHHRYYWGGYRPWPGYGGPSTGEMIAWGLVGWGLGKLIFDSGYQSYSNPYPVQPVQTIYKTEVTYQEPITTVAEQTAPTDESTAEKMAENSESFIEKSQQAFKTNDFLTALDYANKAVAESPGDGALHEYRALVLFALGKFGEAAGVLNPVLVGSPGWDWTTMITVYDTQETYVKQLQALENYVKGNDGSADGHFLLGYHYMVCGHLENAADQFEAAVKIQPADTVSKQLAELARSSTASGEEDDTDTEDLGDVPEPKPVDAEKLPGSWVSDKGEEGKVTLSLKDDGKFEWTFSRKGKEDSSFGGEYTINEEGLLVLDAGESQMVGTIQMPSDSELQFVLAGGPTGDPGLSFNRS
ncbi:tetratricopeptide repeat protein [Haloferula rosea]|uniref:Tetratricopeptide repeat protein n=1 Tax=Haloferula rosea TaxID=490093 RepID=A0A934RD79_9BACT|nr:hypothetical protein [Haloferula rosea]MBK1827563.1 hypothetical protein [Haloferula rosea]